MSGWWRAAFAVCFLTSTAMPGRAAGRARQWNDPSQWNVNKSDGVFAEVDLAREETRKSVLQVEFNLGQGGWVELKKQVEGFTLDSPVAFDIKANSEVDLEIKFSDKDGSVFGRRMNLKNKYSEWTSVVIYPQDTEYWWSGDNNKLNEVTEFYLAFAGRGYGIIHLDNVRAAGPELASSFGGTVAVLDPDRDLQGFGFRQRRSETLTPEDTGVLRWLEVQQDAGSPEKALVPSMEDDIGHTFNNALAAMAFMVKDRQGRAERILDFYAKATKRDNQEKSKQNFFYKGEPRGFYQQVFLRHGGPRGAYYAVPGSDRWVGDMAWLLLAYKHHEQKYGAGSAKYAEIRKLLKELIVSYYKETGETGYIQHGWRRDDSQLHEDHGHPEANIDCYAVLRLVGEDELADKVSAWLKGALEAGSLPLDLYSWRVLAFGQAYSPLLDVVEHDLRYRKMIQVSGKPAAGFYSTPREDVQNIWLDGTAHMACAFFAAGDRARGRFYANQMDAFLIPKVMKGVNVKALPYAANQGGDYRWVDVEKGFSSVAAWYIFAKNGFNPMTLKFHPVK